MIFLNGNFPQFSSTHSYCKNYHLTPTKWHTLIFFYIFHCRFPSWQNAKRCDKIIYIKKVKREKRAERKKSVSEAEEILQLSEFAIENIVFFSINLYSKFSTCPNVSTLFINNLCKRNRTQELIQKNISLPLQNNIETCDTSPLRIETRRE